eukprot:SAG31_NODE_22953_length_514_cov_1.055422_1_plen_40_part_01
MVRASGTGSVSRSASFALAFSSSAAFRVRMPFLHMFAFLF